MPISSGEGITTGTTTPTSCGAGIAIGLNRSGWMRDGTMRGFTASRGRSSSGMTHGVGGPPTSPGTGQPEGPHPAPDFVGSAITQASPAAKIIAPATIVDVRIANPPRPGEF